VGVLILYLVRSTDCLSELMKDYFRI